MALSDEELDALVRNPTESLSVELKNWIDPNTPEGQSKIIKAAIALRNNDGGYLLIGFDDATCQPNFDRVPDNVGEQFHIDNIQGLVSRYSSEAFEINVHFPTIGNAEFVVIEIPSGVRAPIACKRILRDSDQNLLLRDNVVFVRSLRANNTPSTTEAKCVNLH